MEEFRFEHLNKNSHLPYYVQIKYYLRHLIKELGPNALIPSETELADLFGVSRGTAKQAGLRGRPLPETGQGDLHRGCDPQTVQPPALFHR